MLNILQILKPFSQETKSGLIIFDKPAEITTNDLIYQVRKEYGTRKVGAAGVLDPFATGAVIIGIGNCTKDLTQFENCDKVYEFETIFGIQTLSGDNQDIVLSFEKGDCDSFPWEGGSRSETEGVIDHQSISTFPKSYFQEVPLLSSVKVQGHKLRELTRKNIGNIEWLSGYEFNSELEREVNFKNSGIVLKVPRRKVEIKSLELIEAGTKTYEEIIQNASEEFISSLNSFPWSEGSFGEGGSRSETEGVIDHKDMKNLIFQSLKLKATVSKGTYIRKLAEDIAHRNDGLGCVIGLRRNEYFY